MWVVVLYTFYSMLLFYRRISDMIDENVIQQIEDVYEQVNKANKDLYGIWKQHLLFTVEWWIGLGLIIIPWLIWIVLHKKRSRSRLLFAGFIVIIISCWLDFLGSTSGLWFYPMKVEPTIPAYIIWDMTLFPVSIMLVLQYTKNINPLLIAIIYSAIISFAAEPFFEWINFYRPLHWKSIFSFPIYILLYLIAYFISKRNTFDPL